MYLSIIIPTYNRCSVLNDALISIVRNFSNEVDAEVIVVDNGSSDDTYATVMNISNSYPGKNIRYVVEPEPGLLSGRHKGAEEAQGQVLCFLDDDVELSPSWLNTIAETFRKRPEVELVTGPCLPKFEVYPPAWLKYFWSTYQGGTYCGWLSLLDLGNEQQFIQPNYVWGLNFCIRKSTFETLRGFNPDIYPPDLQILQGDGETGLTIKAAANGCKALYHPGALLYHMVSKERLTMEYFGKRAYIQGICDSFTLLRSQHGLDENSIGIKLNWKGMAIRNIKKTPSRIIEFLKVKKRGMFLPAKTREINAFVKQNYTQGFTNHQHAFYSSETIKNWVLKPDFLNYKLPKL